MHQKGSKLMESITAKIQSIMKIKKLSTLQLSKLLNRVRCNLEFTMDNGTYKIKDLERIANTLDYDLEINFIDRITGEKI